MSAAYVGDCPREQWLRVALPWLASSAGLIASTGAFLQLLLQTGHFRPLALIGHLLLFATGLFWFDRPPLHASRAAFFVSAYLSTLIGTFILTSGEVSSFTNLAVVSLGAIFTIPRRRFMLAAQAVALLWVVIALMAPLKTPSRGQLILVGGMVVAVAISTRFARNEATRVVNRDQGEGAASDRRAAPRRVEPPDARGRESTEPRPLCRELVHDVNNLLGGILGGADLALASERHPEDLQFALHQIREKTIATRDYLRDAVRGRSALEPLTLEDLVERAVALARGPAGAEIAFVTERANSVPPIRGVRSDLERAVLNLLQNAIEATPRSGGAVRVQVRPERGARGECAVVRVEDEGSGIPPGIRARIFEPGFTTRAGEHRGLGLAFVARVVAAHGGVVVIDEQWTRGSAIELHLPADPGTSRTMDVGSRSALDGPDEPTGGRSECPPSKND